MANATGPVSSFVVHYGEGTMVPLAATATTYYPGAMIGLDASDNGVKLDAAGTARAFVGINAEGQDMVVNSGEAAGDRSILVKRPERFAMAIASAAAGDHDRPVYALYDNEVTYTPSAGSVFVGWVDRVLSSTSVLIKPEYAPIPMVGGTAVNITAATALTLRDAGRIYTIDQDAAFDIDLPSPTVGAGLEFKFVLTDAGANAVTITVAGAAATFVGIIVNDVTSVLPATGATLTFVSGTAAVGDTIVITSLSSTLYHVLAYSSAAGGITIA